MALVVYDRVQETTATTGTGSITLGGAVDGFQSFAIVGNGNTTYYCIVNGVQWEVGLGTYSTSGPTLARTTVYSNSSGTLSPITLSGASNVFLTYPSERSVNLDASGNVTALGTVTSGAWNGSTIPVAYGGTGVTTSSGANSVMLRDANQNVAINRLNQANTNVSAAGGITALTAASSYSQTLTGTGSQTYTMPDATTLATGVAFVFNNNATGTLTLQDYASGSIGVVTSGGAVELICVSSSTTGGTWDYHGFLPENVTWGTNALALGSTVITGGTWNGGTIQSGYGGTGLTTFTAANNALYSTSSSALAAGTLPIAAGGTAKTSFTANQVLYGSLSQSGNLLFDGASLTVGGATITGSGSQIAGGAWGVLPYAFNSLTIDNSGGAARFFATGANSSTYGSYIWYGGLTTGATNQYMTLDTTGNLLLNTSTAGGKITSVASSGQLVAGNFSGASGQFTLALSIAGGNNMYLATVSNADESLRFINSGGGELVRITSTGYVGIGVSNPTQPLQVSRNLSGIIASFTNQTSADFQIDLTAGVTLLTPSTSILAFGTANTERMRLNSTGLGIGTASPGAKLDVYVSRTSSTNAISLLLSDNVTGAQTNGVYKSIRSQSNGSASVSEIRFVETDGSNNNTAISFATQNTAGALTERMRVGPSGSIIMNPTSAASGAILDIYGGGSGALGAIRIGDNNYSAGHTNYWDIGRDNTFTGDFTFYLNSVEKMRITTAGALSFGAGGSNYGSSGQLLQSNGNASPSWINQSSITAGSASNVAGLVQNAYSSYTNIASTTPKSGFYGMLCGTSSLFPALMFDASGGGFYREHLGYWALYYSYANASVGFGSSATTSGIALQVNGIGYATNDFRAPIFYDSNDTNYYLDPAGSSALTTATFNVNGSSSIILTSAGTNASMIKAGPSDELYIGGNDTWQMRFSGGNALMDNGGYLQNNQSIRSPIFYDSNDTTYYGDFASTGDNALKVRGGAMFGPNTTWGEFLYVGTNGNPTTSSASVASTNGNLHLDAKNGQVIYLNNYSTSSYTIANQSIRSPLFYDLDNTAYYGNFAGRSLLYTLSTANSDELLWVGDSVSTSNKFGIAFNTTDLNYAIYKPTGAWTQPLRINFYTGIQIWSHSSYDYGTSFWNFATSTKIMSVGEGDNNVRVPGDIRSQVYYDINNTGYYIDPSSTGVSFRFAGSLVGEQSNWSGEANKIQWHSNNLYFQNTGDANFVFRQGSGAEPFVLNIPGAYGTASGSWRAPSFIDSNNTGYYLDPSSSSNLFSASFDSIITSNMATGSGNIGQLKLQGVVGTNWYNIIITRPGVADSCYFFASDAWGPNGNAATQWIGSMGGTGRSINATGTINASGSDYAEYMAKAGDFTIAKGDICGVDINGKLTNVFADAISFVVKSTNPSYVGGDEWGTEAALNTPIVMYPIQADGETDESFAQKLAQYEIDKPIFDVKFEAARAKVDRIAFSGQVPVNVTGATAGQYIIPVDDNGAIKGIAVDEDDLTMSQYIKAVGKVIKVVDGRPTIIVKVS